MTETKPKTFREIHMNGEGLRTLAVYRLFFRKALRQELAVRAAYDAEVEDWYTNGDGAPADWQRAGDQPWFDPENDDPDRMVNLGGAGYRFPECPHGTSLWTDYDNICGACEESETPIQAAIVRGREQYLRFISRWEWMTTAPGDLPVDIRHQLNEWAISLFPTTAEVE